jgi:hypothetical protein
MTKEVGDLPGAADGLGVDGWRASAVDDNEIGRPFENCDGDDTHEEDGHKGCPPNARAPTEQAGAERTIRPPGGAPGRHRRPRDRERVDPSGGHHIGIGPDAIGDPHLE